MYSHGKKKGRRHHRYGCFGASWPMRPMKMAYAYGYAVPDDALEDDARARDERDGGERGRSTWYAHREHRGRRGHRSGNFGVRRPLR